MKNKLQQFIVKLLAATLAIIMAVPTNVSAMSQRKSNTYTAATSVMGIQPKDDAPETETSQETNLLKSAVSTEETTDYIIEKSANLSQTTGQVTYKIAVKTKDPSQEFTENQTTTFGITENTDLKDLKVEKVQALDADGKEIDVKNTLNTPKAFNSTDNIRTLGITATKPQYGMVYYLSAQLTEEALKNLEEKSPQLALDITIASPNQDIFQTRYSLETTKPDSTEITIDNEGNLVNQTSDLIEKEDNLHLYKGEYKKEEKTLFQTTPAHLVWTDYINAKDDKEFTINFDLDENQDSENSQIKIDYYEARDKGYVLNQSFSKTVDFTNSLNLTIPQGYIAKVSLSTAIKGNTNAKEYTFNGVKVANPTYKEEKTEKTEEEQASDDADPLPDDSSKNDEEAKPSNDSIADESKQDFSQNPKSETSAIALNKEAYLENLRDEEKLTENLEKAANDIELALESYNKEETNWDEFKATIKNIAKEQNLDQTQTEETLQALLAGLNEDKYKVANIDTKEATNLVEESTVQSEPIDATEKSVDQLVKEKLNEEGITIEDFQNYMYELEEKYGLTDEDAARIYGDNAEVIQKLVTKAQDEKTTGEVFASIDSLVNREFNLVTKMNVLAIPNWQIPAGWWFDINIGPYLKPDSKNPLKDLTDSNGNVVATPEYIQETNTIRYYFPKSVKLNTNLPIDQKLAFNTANIPQGAQSIDINISVKPKNNTRQSMPTITVNTNEISPVTTAFPDGKVPAQTTPTSDAMKRTYPYDVSYWTYQYWDGEKINWDIKINTSEVKLDYLNFNNLGLALYAPENQSLEEYKVTIQDYKGSQFSDNTRGVTSNGKLSGETQTGTLKQSGNMMTFNTQLKKSELPDQLYIHVEATPKANSPIYQMYDLGIRLTPDVNYISDILEDFKDDWAKLVAMAPWVIPYKSGEAAAEKFANGFNILDTRLPADAKAGWAYDNTFDGRSYNDKSRSLYGKYNDIDSSNDITWQVSDTLRLQDDERLLDSNSTLGNDIIGTSRLNDNQTNISGPQISVLEPNTDGSFAEILSADNLTADSLRESLRRKRPAGLLPGTIINYTYTSKSQVNTQASKIDINFNNRYDDGAGNYGGNNSASINKESRQSTPRVTGEDPGHTEETIPGDYKIRWVDWSREDVGMIIDNPEYIRYVYCINANLYDPPMQYSKLDSTRINDPLPSTLMKHVKKASADYWPNLSDKDLELQIKKVFYYADQYKGFNSDFEKYYAIQVLIYRAMDGKLGKEYPEDLSFIPYAETYDKGYVGKNEMDHLVFSGTYSNIYRGISLNSSKKYKIEAVRRLNNFIANPTYKASDNEIKEAVKLDLYHNNISNIQNSISATVKNPLEFDKINEIGERLEGAKFSIINDKGSVVKSFTSDLNSPIRIYLEEGTYKLREDTAPEGYDKLPEITFNVEKISKSVEVETSTNNPTTSRKKLDAYELRHNFRFKIINAIGSDLVEVNNDSLGIKATNKKTEEDKTWLKIDKKILGADKKYHKFSNVKFTLTPDGNNSADIREGITASNGEIVFEDLPADSKWILTETVPEGIEQPQTTQWSVRINANGKVEITNTPNNPFSWETVSTNDSYIIKNEPQEQTNGSFKISKVDSTNQEVKLEGARFQLLNSSKIIIRDETSDETGELLFDDLPAGEYKLIEKTAPNGYQVDPTNDTWTVTVDKDTGNVTIKDESGNSQSGNTLEYEIKNKKIPSYEFKLKKVSEDNPERVIEGAEFTLTGPDPSTESIPGKTDANGVISFEDLKPGSYQLVENNPAPGYYKSDKTWTVTITNDGEAYYRENPNSNVATNTIDENEEYSDSRLAVDKSYGTFNLASIINVFRIPEAYAASSGWEKVDLARSNPVTQSSNEVKTKITEVNKSTKQFKQIFLIDGNKNNQNNDFNLNIKRVPNGSLDQNQVSVRVFTVDSSSTVDNLINPGNNLNLQGVTNDNNYLGEVKIRFNATGNRGFSKANIFAIEVTTSYNQGSPLGLKMDYFHTRSGAPSNWKSYTGSQYYTSENEINKAVKGEERGYEESVIPVANSTEYDPNLDKGKVRIVEGNEGIKRTHYIYETENGVRTGVKRIDTSKGTNGVEIIKQMTPTIKYIGTKPLGPEQSTSTFTRNITINYETETRQDPDLKMGEKEVIQKGQMGTVTNKYSITYEKSSGADVPKIKDWPSDIDIEKNRPGNDWRVVEYKVIEESGTPPTTEIVRVGTKYVKQPGDISVRDNNGYAVITNKPIEFKIIKSNSSGEKLSGAEFTLYTDKDATQEISIKDVPATVKTDNDGIATFKALPANTYYLKETKAPNGYVPLSKVWKIVVRNDGVMVDEKSVEGKYSIIPQTDTDSATLKVINNQPTYPSTGGSGTFIGFALIGTAIMLAGIAYYGIYVNDKNRRRSNRYDK